MAGWLFNKRGKRVDEFLCLVETWNSVYQTLSLFFSMFCLVGKCLLLLVVVVVVVLVMLF